MVLTSKDGIGENIIIKRSSLKEKTNKL